MLEGIPHSFEGGMNQDLSSTKRQPNVYWEGTNVTLSVDNDTELGDLRVSKGNTFKFNLPRIELDNIGNQLFVRHAGESVLQTFDIGTLASTYSELEGLHALGQKIIGYTFIRETLVLFTTTNNGANGASCIWKYNLKTDTNPTLVYVGVLNFSKNHPIQAVSNYESVNVQKVYWVDGINELRSFNIADSNGILLSSDKLDIDGNVSLTNISLDSVGTNGLFETGVIQYAYQYYNKSGSESSLSPVMSPITIGSSLVQGDVEQSVINKSFSLTITSDTTWDKIRVFRIHYTDNLFEPTVSVILDQSNSQDLSFTDDGSLFLYSFDYDAFRLIRKNSFKPKGLSIKDQRLFAYNYSEEVYDPDYDVRAYRFPLNSLTTTIVHNGQNVSIGTGFQIAGQNVPENYDCINPDNANESIDYTTDQIYKQSSSTIGASGRNVSIEFSTETIRIDNDYTDYESITRFSGIGSAEESQKRSWRRDEIYRVGVILIDNKGRKSLPKWICDLRIPDNITISDAPGGNVINANYIYPTFTFNNLPSDCQGVQIIRVDRTDLNKTILSQGYIQPLMRQFGNTIYYPIGSSHILSDTDILIYNATNNYSTGELVYLPSYDQIKKIDAIPPPSNATEVQVEGASIAVQQSDFSDYRAVTRFMNTTTAEPESGNHIITYTGEVSKTVFSFYSPEVSINKTIETGTNKYLNLLQHLSTAGHYYEDTSTSPITGIVDIDDDTDNTWNFEKAMLSVSLTGSYTKKMVIAESPQILKPDEETTLPLSGVEIKNIPNPTLNYNHRNGTALFILGTTPDYPLNDHGYHIVNYKRPLLNQYGGQTYDARLNNDYIIASEFKSKTGSSATVTAKYGDTFISEWNHFPSYYRASNICRTNSVLMVVESDYDLSKHIDTDLTNLIVDNGISDIKNYIQNNWREFNEDGTNRNYKIRDIYQKKNDIITEFAIGDSIVITNFETTVKASNFKIPNESVDSWLNFPALNYIDVNGSYGPINHISELNDNLIFFQDNAIGVLSINPRYTVQSDEGSAVIGTGGILDDFKYLSTSTGCKHRWSIVKGAKFLYYYDEYDNEIKTIDGSELTTAVGVKSILNKKINLSLLNDKHTISQGIITGYDKLNNLVYFTFKQGTNSFTLVLNENLGVFESLLDACPTWWINANNLYSVTNNSLLDPQEANAKDAVYQEGIGEYGNYYGNYVDSKLNILTSPKPLNVIVPTNLEWDTRVIELGVDKEDETFDSVRMYNDYQDTGVLDTSLNGRRRLRTWRYTVPRNEGSSDRLRDYKHHIVFSYTNDGFKKLIFKYLKVFFQYEPIGI